VTTTLPVDSLEADLLIVGAGGAGLVAALHAHEISAKLRIVIAVKGLLGQSGCTRMVQGGFNAVLDPSDSLERHFEDTVNGGAFLNNQVLAWKLVEEAPKRIIELENKVGCVFDRNPDGTIHQKPFAGQSFDRTVHRGDLTGIEIMSNLRDYILEADVRVLQECRGLDLLTTGNTVSGALFLDIRTGRSVAVRARATLLATGGFMLMPFGSTFTLNNLGISSDSLSFIYFVTGLCTLVTGPFVGRLSDRIGKYRLFCVGTALTIVMVLIYTRLGHTPLPVVILINVLLFVGVTSRMISASALISAVPDPAHRGSFMSVNSSLQQAAGGVGAAVAGLIVVQTASGALAHYELLGYVVVAAMVIVVVMLRGIDRMVAAGGK